MTDNLSTLAVVYLSAVSSALLSVYLTSDMALIDLVQAKLGDAIVAGFFFVAIAFVVVKVLS